MSTCRRNLSRVCLSVLEALQSQQELQMVNIETMKMHSAPKCHAQAAETAGAVETPVEAIRVKFDKNPVPRKAAVQILGENAAEVESYQNKAMLTKIHLVADQN